MPSINSISGNNSKSNNSIFSNNSNITNRITPMKKSDSTGSSYNNSYYCSSENDS